MSNRRYMRHYRIEGQALPIRLELPGALATAPVTELSERLGQRLIPSQKTSTSACWRSTTPDYSERRPSHEDLQSVRRGARRRGELQL